MSVYTQVASQDVETLLVHYDIGRLQHLSGIENGIENSNYTLDTSTGRFILTLYESLCTEEAANVIQLMQQLQQHDYPAPIVQQDKQGCFLKTLQQKPAAIFLRHPGSSTISPTPEQCKQLGRKLAQLHCLSPKISFNKPNTQNLAGCLNIFEQIKPLLPAGVSSEIQAEFAYQQQRQDKTLPSGLIHADLFRDNVLFDNGNISAVLDFYTACNDCFILDLAIACNDWCYCEAWQNENASALLQGYQSVRYLSADEKSLFPVYLRFAALRFWLSRLHHQLFPLAGQLTLHKDPEIFHQLLRVHQSRKIIIDFDSQTTLKQGYG